MSLVSEPDFSYYVQMLRFAQHDNEKLLARNRIPTYLVLHIIKVMSHSPRLPPTVAVLHADYHAGHTVTNSGNGGLRKKLKDGL